MTGNCGTEPREGCIRMYFGASMAPYKKVVIYSKDDHFPLRAQWEAMGLVSFLKSFQA